MRGDRGDNDDAVAIRAWLARAHLTSVTLRRAYHSSTTCGGFAAIRGGVDLYIRQPVDSAPRLSSRHRGVFGLAPDRSQPIAPLRRANAAQEQALRVLRSRRSRTAMIRFCHRTCMAAKRNNAVTARVVGHTGVLVARIVVILVVASWSAGAHWAWIEGHVGGANTALHPAAASVMVSGPQVNAKRLGG